MVILVDAKNVAFRMNWSFQSLRTTEGVSTAVLYGFWKEIFRLHKLAPEASFIFCWDGFGKSWRHNLNMGYKAKRYDSKEARDAKERVIAAEEILRPLFQELGFWTPRIEGVEGDDLIGILAKTLGKKQEVRIYSSDKDFCQLVDKTISTWPDWERKPLDEIAVEKMWGVPPKHVTEIRAMIGDSSDKLKGMPGVGPKRAIQYWAAGIRPSRGNIDLESLPVFKAHWPRVLIEYKMATIITDPTDAVWSEEQKEKLTRLVQLVSECQGKRRAKREKEIEGAWYGFIAKYELSDIFKERHLLWKIL